MESVRKWMDPSAEEMLLYMIGDILRRVDERTIRLIYNPNTEHENLIII